MSRGSFSGPSGFRPAGDEANARWRARTGVWSAVNADGSIRVTNGKSSPKQVLNTSSLLDRVLGDNKRWAFLRSRSRISEAVTWPFSVRGIGFETGVEAGRQATRRTAWIIQCRKCSGPGRGPRSILYTRHKSLLHFTDGKGRCMAVITLKLI